MYLSLIIPDLPPPQAMPGLARLLAACTTFSPWQDGIEALLCARFGIARQVDWPLAPLLATADGADADEDYWLCADPVHLRADRDTVTLVGAPSCTAEEASALIATLNAHFAQDAVCFVAPAIARTPTHWYLRCERALDVITRSFSQVRGRSLFDSLPRGAEGKTVRGWLNEAQMLLHEHPVNNAREAHGEPVINGIWLWGGGRYAPPKPSSYASIWGEDRILAALVAADGKRLQALPEHAKKILLASVSTQRALVLLPGDRRGIDASWFTPLADALDHGDIEAIDLALGGSFGDEEGWRIGACRRAARNVFGRWFARPPDIESQIARLRRAS